MLCSVRKERGGKWEKQKGKIANRHSYQPLGFSNVRLQDEGRVKGQHPCQVGIILKPFWPTLSLPPRRDFWSLGPSGNGLGKTEVALSVSWWTDTAGLGSMGGRALSHQSKALPIPCHTFHVPKMSWNRLPFPDSETDTYSFLGFFLILFGFSSTFQFRERQTKS